MEEEEVSRTRFSTLVSGTAAGQITNGSFTSLHKIRHGNQGTHELPPDGRETLQSLRTPFGKNVAGQAGRILTTSGDLIRRNRTETSRTSLLGGMRFLSPSAQANTDVGEAGYEQHTANEGMTSAAPSHNNTRSAQPRGFVKLRTSKSMHQRPENISSSVEQPSHGHLHQRSVTQHPTNYDAPSHHSARSRSASVASSALAQAPLEDDISSIMMRGANDLRNSKFEMEELRREITFLQSQVEASNLEKEEISHRLKAVKAAAKQGLELTSRSLEDVRASVEGLKAQSEASFAFAAQAKAALPDVVELKEVVAEAVKELQLVTSEDGRLTEVLRTKEIIDELKSECSGSSQVIDMLRDKLQSVGSELVDAKNRVSELEGFQSADREALRTSSLNLSSAGEQIRKLAEDLKSQQVGLNEALISTADFESKLGDANTRIQELGGIIAEKDDALGQLSALRLNLEEARVLLKEREARLEELRGLQEKLELVTKEAAQQSSEVRVLKTSIASKDEMISNLEARIPECEAQLQATQDTAQSLKGEIATISAREDGLRRELVTKKGDVEQMQIRQAETQDSLDDTRKQLGERSESLHEIQVKYQVMEERYEIQLVTTKCAQETQAELQERLLEAQAKYARELEAATGKRDSDIALLAEQKASLLAKVDDLEASARLQREDLIAIKADYDDRVSKLDETHRIQLELAEKHLNEMHVTLEDARAAAKSQEEQIAHGKQEIQTLREELREAMRPSPVHKDAVDALTAQIAALSHDNTELVLRARSIDSRYRTGDLNEEEKVFINTLIQTSQSIHEQELVSKGNELRRRDNLVKELQAKIQSLESALNKHLKYQSKTVAAQAADSRSLIDPAAWAASSNNGSTHPRVADEDLPSTNVDNTITAKPTPAPAHLPSRAPLAVVPQPDPNTTTKARPTRPPARLLRHPPAGAPTAKGTPVAAKKTVSPVQSSSPLVYPQPKTPAVRGRGAHENQKKPISAAGNAQNGTKPMFSRLATDCSDEIVEFEEKSLKPSPIGTPPEANVNGDAQGRARLGKRDKPASSPEGGQNNSKRPRRLRSHMRSRAAPQQDEPVQKNTERAAKIKAMKGRGH